MESVYCRYCYKDIDDRDKLVTASNWLRVKPYHYQCFEKVEEETPAVWLSWKPLNGPNGNISFVLMFILSAWFLVSDTLETIGDIVGALALYPVILRLLSILIYERRVPDLRRMKEK